MECSKIGGKVLAAGIEALDFVTCSRAACAIRPRHLWRECCCICSFIRSSALFFVPDDADDHDEQRACIVLLFAVLDRAGRKPGSCHDRSCVHAGTGCAADQFDPEFLENDYLSGLIRFVDAFLTAGCIAIGVGVALRFWMFAMGGIL